MYSIYCLEVKSATDISNMFYVFRYKGFLIKFSNLLFHMLFVSSEMFEIKYLKRANEWLETWNVDFFSNSDHPFLTKITYSIIVQMCSANGGLTTFHTIYLSFPIVFVFIFFTFLFFPFSIFSIGIWNLMLYQFNLCPLCMYVIYEVKKSFLRKVPGISIAVSMFGHHSFFSWDMVFA